MAYSLKSNRWNGASNATRAHLLLHHPPYWQTAGYDHSFDWTQYELLQNQWWKAKEKSCCPSTTIPALGSCSKTSAPPDSSLPIPSVGTKRKKNSGELVICNWKNKKRQKCRFCKKCKRVANSATNFQSVFLKKSGNLSRSASADLIHTLTVSTIWSARLHNTNHIKHRPKRLTALPPTSPHHIRATAPEIPCRKSQRPPPFTRARPFHRTESAIPT